MCGIAGIYKANTAEREKLVKMTGCLAHRGPDGESHWISDDGKVALGHRRLSIIDLSSDGRQPMHFADRYVITFNGEIYNYLELREALEKKNVIFKSKTDTEVLLALYALDGPACLQKLDGMFAFVIYDRHEKKLFGARDRFGEKPFYYSFKQGDEFIFASEIKALLAAGAGNDLNNAMLGNFLVSNYSINNPQSLKDTFYRNIFKLPAASFFTLDSNLELRVEEYWNVNPSAINETITFGEAKEEFHYLLSQSVAYRLRSDVPVGSSLSGGLDSSSIVCLINEANKDQQIKQNTFSARFKDFNKDEGEFMQKVIDKTNAAAYFTWPDEEGFIHDFKDLLYYQDEPFPSASIYAQYCVMKKAKEKNVTVLLDGQGADEILAGYEYYLQTYLNGLKKAGHPDYASIQQSVINNNANFKVHEEQIFQNPGTSLKDIFKNVVRPVYKLVKPGKYSAPLSKPGSLLTEEFINALGVGWKYDFSYDQDRVKEHLWYSVKYHNLEDLLRFSDRNSMAHSREVRLPFLSTKLVEFMFTLPAEFLIQKGWTKYILREALKDLLPAEIAWRKDKIGYEPPQKTWLKNPVFISQTEEQKKLLIKEKIINKNYAFNEDNNWSILMTKSLLS